MKPSTAQRTAAEYRDNVLAALRTQSTPITSGELVGLLNQVLPEWDREQGRTVSEDLVYRALAALVTDGWVAKTMVKRIYTGRHFTVPGYAYVDPAKPRRPRK